ncbi:hypothetical protein [Microvirga lenta]|nr:hypothetical protein [Microvirga lenta]
MNEHSMDILLRFLTLTLRENQTELQRSDMLRDQMLTIAAERHLA